MRVGSIHTRWLFLRQRFYSTADGKVAFAAVVGDIEIRTFPFSHADLARSIRVNRR